MQASIVRLPPVFFVAHSYRQAEIHSELFVQAEKIIKNDLLKSCQYDKIKISEI